MEDTLELIKAISPELREQFQKDYIKIKVWQRKMLGWAAVHKEFNEKINKRLALFDLNDRVIVTLKRLIAKQPARQRTADTLELIQALPVELRERILNEYIKIKTWQRKMLGWEEVHDQIKKAPFCGDYQQIVKTFFCLEDKGCGGDGICVPCMRKRNKIHNIFPDIDEYTPISRSFIEICDDYLEHYFVKTIARGLDPNSLDYLLE